MTRNRAINLQKKLASFEDQWAPKVVAEMNDYQFKLVKLQGDFVWHNHQDTDETFIVLHGEMSIDFRDGSVPLAAGDMCVVPQGVDHKPAISEFPKWRKYLISLSFRGQSSVRPVQVGGFDVNIVIHRSTAVRGRGGPARHDAWPPSLGAILAHTDGPCGS